MCTTPNNVYRARHVLASIAAVLLMMTVATAQVRVVAPNGGERFRVGSSVTLRWAGVPATDTVSIEYSTDAGGSWLPVTNSATGLQHTWSPVPNTPSTRCLLRVSKASSVGDSVLYLRSTRAGFALPEAIHFAEFSPDGTRVIGGGAEGDVYIWDSFTGALLQTVRVELRANIPSPPATPGITLISCVHYSPDGTLFATISPLPDSTGAMVRIFSAAGVKLREWRHVDPAPVPSSATCAFSPDGTRIMVTGLTGGAVYTVATGAFVSRLKGYTAPTVTSSMIDGDWRFDGADIIGVSLFSTNIPEVVVSDPITGDTIRTFSFGSTPSYSTVRYSPDGARFIAAYTDGMVRVFDAVAGTLVYDKKDYSDFATSADYSRDGAFFATSGQDASTPNWKLLVYDAATGAFVRQAGAIINGMRSLDFSPDGSRILTACIDGVRIFRGAPVVPGQSDVSDTLWEIYLDSNASVEIAAPLVTAKQGESLDVPITINDPGAALGAGATRIDVTLRYNASLLEPIGTTPSGTVTAKERTIALSLPITSATDTVLARLSFRAALGDDSTTVLDLMNPTANISTVAVAERDGLFRLADLCREGGARLLNPNGIVALRVVRAGIATSAEVETIESGRTRLELCNMRGDIVRRYLNEEIEPGHWMLPLDLSNVPQGRYLLVLTTPTVRKTQQVEVLR